VLEQFYAQLRPCRARCNGNAYLEHFADEAHECGQVIPRRMGEHDCAAMKYRALACQPDECRPLVMVTVSVAGAGHAALARCPFRHRKARNPPLLHPARGQGRREAH
jgi:hypothetical protein